ncbi:MAG: hypothetical protein RIS54_2100 [Verrucomicrobiota bacterium]|jgi:hypothetical protein
MTKQLCPLIFSAVALASAALAAPAAKPEDKVVELPPLTIEETVTTPWWFASVGEAEILSRLPEEVTRQLIRRQYRLHALLQLLIPSSLQVRRELPRLYVFYNAQNQPAVNRDMVAQIEAQEKAAGTTEDATGKLHVGFMPNFRFWDEDSLGIFFVVDPNAQDREDISLSAGYVRYLMTARAPAAPGWFIEGVMTLYNNAELSVPPLKSPLDIMAATQLLEAPRNDRDEFTLQPLDASAFAATGPRGTYAPLPPLAALLGTAGAPGATPEQLRATAALFVRWALDPGRKSPRRGQLEEQPRVDGVPARTVALWKYTERASRQHVDEAWFQDCFGLDYAAATQVLQAYLPAAARDTLVLRAAQPVKVPDYVLREATPLEVSQVRGEITRLEIDYVRELLPSLVEPYLAQARRTLRRAYDLGERAPRLLASMGLCEVDARDDAAALPFLRAAADGGVRRAMAWYHLARIEFDQLTARKAGVAPKREELKDILAHLGTAREQSPALLEVYELYAKIWTAAELPLTRNATTLFYAGVQQFPQRPRMLYAVAALFTQHGRHEEAAPLVARGLALATTPAQHERFKRLLPAAP